MIKRALPGLVSLLMLLVGSAYLTQAAGPPAPTPPPPQPNEPIEAEKLQQLVKTAQSVGISIVVRSDGTWSGQARLSGARSTPAPCCGEQAQREDGPVSEAFCLEGDDLQQLAEVIFFAEDVTTLLAGPVVLELGGPVREGQRLELALPSNPSTGCSWAVETPDGSALVQVGDVETRQMSRGLGTLARQVFRFRAARTAMAALQLTYRRAWEAEATPTRVMSVQAGELDLAEVCTVLSASLPQPAPLAGLESAEEERGTLPPRQDSSLTSVQALPSSFNWCDLGGCPPVRNQGEFCGSCWAFATVGPLESSLLISESLSTDLSEQYLLSCNTHSWGCNGGWFAHDYHYNYAAPGEPEPGAVLESAFGYTESDVTPCNGPYNHPHGVSSWQFIAGRPFPTEANIKQAIYDHGPVGAAVCVDTDFHGYDTGIFETDESAACGSGEVNHAIVLVGWDDSQGTSGVWILRNSWGTGWGEGGYMRIGYGVSNVGFDANYIVYTPTASSPPFTPTGSIYLPLVMADYPATLDNGGFERGSDGSWSEYSTNGWDLVLHENSLPVDAHSGGWAAWLGGDNNETSILSQYVAIPSDATTLNYWYWAASQDLCGYDSAYVRFGSTPLRTYDLCYDTYGWTQQQIDVTGWREQTVELQFVVTTDAGLHSSFYLDDVSLSTP